jgi:putative endonuclease
MPDMNAKHIGDHGEALAAEYLSEAGYRILDRNYRYERAEIDVVCFDATAARGRGEIVFVEVKTRSGRGFGSPEEAITDEKQRHIVHAAEAYLYERRLEGAPVRFDVVSIVLNQGSAPDINHIKEAFWAS